MKYGIFFSVIFYFFTFPYLSFRCYCCYKKYHSKQIYGKAKCGIFDFLSNCLWWYAFRIFVQDLFFFKKFIKSFDAGQYLNILPSLKKIIKPRLKPIFQLQTKTAFKSILKIVLSCRIFIESIMSKEKMFI